MWTQQHWLTSLLHICSTFFVLIFKLYDWDLQNCIDPSYFIVFAKFQSICYSLGVVVGQTCTFEIATPDLLCFPQHEHVFHKAWGIHHFVNLIVEVLSVIFCFPSMLLNSASLCWYFMLSTPLTVRKFCRGSTLLQAQRVQKDYKIGIYSVNFQKLQKFIPVCFLLF